LLNFHPVAIVGDRYRWKNTANEPENVIVIDQLIDSLVSRHGEKLYVVTLNTDIGFGKAVERACLFKNVKYVTYSARFGNLPDESSNQPVHLFFQQGKLAAMFGSCVEFHVFTKRSSRATMPGLSPAMVKFMSPVEDVVSRLESQTRLPYTIYNDNNTIHKVYEGRSDAEIEDNFQADQ
jgi:hypothetical protein